MSTQKLIKAVQKLFQQISKFARNLAKGTVHWLLRSLLVLGRQPLLTRSGFVLPTTVLLLLVLTLTVGAIGYRTYTRSVQTIGERQQRVIYNAATPAIDRARSKIEFLFNVQQGDPRFPGGIPGEVQLLGMMYNDGRSLPGNITVPPYRPSSTDPYTFPDETRINVSPTDTTADNAWRYRADTNGDGTADATVVYSIVFSTPNNVANMRDSSATAVQNRANLLQVRQGPLSNATQLNNACQLSAANQAAPPIENGWFRDDTNTSIMRKNFQVNAYVLPDNPNGTVSTLEFYQDRQVNRGNKWGAWFRNDLEVFPGPPFNWNGAMHTEGNLIIGNSSFTAYMISSPFSCLYSQDASEITVAENALTPTTPAFQGQFISGRTGANILGDENTVHLFNGVGRVPLTPGDNFSASTDSVDTPPSGRGPADYALDPIRLQTENISIARNIPNPAATRNDTAWRARDFFRRKRMYNQSQAAPYVDDSYRADNRYGPKPTYENTPIPGAIGGPISGDPKLIGDEPEAGQDDTSLGLDGYWERRARREGLRVLVGQRLDLGDPQGWGGPTTYAQNLTEGKEPLRPWSSCTPNNNGICNEARQRKTLWDNLAAVQATAVYHTAGADRDTPIACIATTVHPGTATTLEESSTFENLAYGADADTFAGYDVSASGGGTPIISDFFRGRGTNGWEFTPPSASEFSNLNSPTMLALRNLSRFAGDPRGGAPSFTPVQDNVVHPYPSMSMFGDFSVLRRVLRLMDTGTSYDSLSPADKTILHTAACTLGLLAYNVDYLEKFDPRNHPLIGNPAENTAAIPDFTNSNAAPTSLRQAIRALNTGRTPLGSFGTNLPASDPTNTSTALSGTWAGGGDRTYDNPEVYIRLLERWRDNTARPLSNADKDRMNQLIYLAQMIITKEQVARDRMLGFFGGSGDSATISTALSRPPYGLCESWIVADRTGSTQTEPLRFLCSRRSRYPVLYNLFPTEPPLVTGTTPPTPRSETAALTIDYSILVTHGEGNLRTRDNVDRNDTYINFIANQSETYRVVRPSDVALRPRRFGETWALPRRSESPSGVTPNNNRTDYVKYCTGPCLPGSSGFANGSNPAAANGAQFYRVAIKDSAFMNGREMMSVRALDLDLDLLRSSPIGSNFWLPQSGIVYAFREDAISEQAIVRPLGNQWSNCGNNNAIQNTASCRMNTGTVSAFQSIDPPLNPRYAITPKPVDYHPDPDRRPNGFRLRNGASLGRPNDNGRGLSFISDNPVYIQGDFNLHRTSGGAPLEEFTDPLTDNFSNFYTRRTLNTDTFAQSGDEWRPSEILADAVTILSQNFCEGSIQDAILTASIGDTATLANANSTQVSMTRYGCPSGNLTSYLNYDRPSTLPTLQTQGTRWMRTNPADVMGLPASTTPNPQEGDSPIVISQGGNPMLAPSNNGNVVSDYTNGYFAIGTDKPRIGAQTARVNSIIISGIVPSRVNQAYGGLHNFPRFLENWSGVPLFISGSFLQLNFSNQATAPFDQDSWEPGTLGNSAESINYYNPPNRRWGYDVGLQYAPAGPIAQRFVTSQAIRSEFYNEPPANDPYIRNLCRAIPGATCPT